MTQVAQRPALFGGEWQSSSDNSWLRVLDPADLRRVVGEVPALTAEDVTRAFDGAETGARLWRSTDPLSRGSVLLGTARLLRERQVAIASDLVSEMGKTLAEATGEVGKAADFFEFYGGFARMPSGYSLNDGREHTATGVRFEPIGIVLAITPWNDPMLTPARKVAPALISGNAVVLKPATETPLVSLHLAQALLDAGLPPSVLSVVTGRGRDISEPLLGDHRLAAITFTGSNAVGRQIMIAASGRNLRIQTEMGGKNAAAVLADADLDLTASTVVAAAFAQAGQRCTATSRLVVDHPVVNELLERISAQIAGLRIGPGADPVTTLGPVVSKAQQESVLDHIATGTTDGGQMTSGGHAPSDAALEHGCFIEPTVFRGTRDMRIWREEVFGPVLVVVEADGFDAVCDAVNDSSFGLSSSLFTTDLKSAHLFVDRADTGQVAVNLPTAGWDVHHPFGGFRDSGSAFKEQGVEALHFYSRAKTYAVRYA